MGLGRIAASIGKGLFAGAAGTAAMTLSSTIEQKLRDREASSVPADAVEQVLDIEPETEDAKHRLGTLAHWGYGTGLGVPRGILGLTGLNGIAATAAHFVAVWGGALAMLPRLDLAPKPTEWGATELAIDAWHHAVYAVAAGAAYEWLDRRGT